MTDTAAALDRVQIFFGESSAAEARVYALLPAADGPADCTLSGVVVGPRCAYASTLEAAAPLVDRGQRRNGGEAALVAEALVADPCFWSPDLPMLYQVRVELRRAGKVIAAVEHTLGIRPLGTRDRKLLFGGRSYVLRGVHRDLAPEIPLQQWREAATAMVAHAPDDELCREASRQGVLLVARLHESGPQLAAAVRCLGRWPAVVLVVIEDAGAIGDALRSEARNALFAQRFGPGASMEAPCWADIIVSEGSDPAVLATRAAVCNQAVIAMRRVQPMVQPRCGPSGVRSFAARPGRPGRLCGVHRVDSMED